MEANPTPLINMYKPHISLLLYLFSIKHTAMPILANYFMLSHIYSIKSHSPGEKRQILEYIENETYLFVHFHIESIRHFIILKKVGNIFYFEDLVEKKPEGSQLLSQNGAMIDEVRGATLCTCPSRPYNHGYMANHLLPSKYTL